MRHHKTSEPRQRRLPIKHKGLIPFSSKLVIQQERGGGRVAAAAIEQEDWELVTCDAAGLPFGMVGELRRKLSPITILVLLLSMGVDLMDIRVSAEFPSLRQRAAFCRLRPERRSGCAKLHFQLGHEHGSECSRAVPHRVGRTPLRSPLPQLGQSIPSGRIGKAARPEARPPYPP